LKNPSIMFLRRIKRGFIYPKFIWAREITALLQKNIKTFPSIMVDAPSGEGIISYWLSQNFPSIHFELYDISKESIDQAKLLLPNSKIEIRDVFSIPIYKAEEIWLLINSVFLLPDVGHLLNRMKPRFKYIVGLFDNIESNNFKLYYKKHPEYKATVLLRTMSKNEIEEFFSNYGYRLVSYRYVTFLPFLHLPKSSIHSLFYFLLDPFLKNRHKWAYWIGLFERNE